MWNKRCSYCRKHYETGICYAHICAKQGFNNSAFPCKSVFFLFFSFVKDDSIHTLCCSKITLKYLRDPLVHIISSCLVSHRQPVSNVPSQDQIQFSSGIMKIHENPSSLWLYSPQSLADPDSEGCSPACEHRFLVFSVLC